jgi:rare lipoprotein A (peptidoglycan hydrolase)
VGLEAKQLLIVALAAFAAAPAARGGVGSERPSCPLRENEIAEFAQIDRIALDPVAEPTRRIGTACGCSVVQQGTASWYGPGFLGHRTATQEIFNGFDYTAASMDFHFQKKICVIRETSCEKIVVRVNDRGNFKENYGRILDLSPAAARALKMTAAGVDKVSVSTDPSCCPALAEQPAVRRAAGAQAGTTVVAPSTAPLALSAARPPALEAGAPSSLPASANPALAPIVLTATALPVNELSPAAAEPIAQAATAPSTIAPRAPTALSSTALSPGATGSTAGSAPVGYDPAGTGAGSENKP